MIPNDLTVDKDYKNRIVCLPYYGALNQYEMNKICEVIENA